MSCCTMHPSVHRICNDYNSPKAQAFLKEALYMGFHENKSRVREVKFGVPLAESRGIESVIPIKKKY